VGWALGELELAPTWPGHAWLVTLALTSQILGWLLISIALPRVPPALTSIVLTLQPVAAVVLARRRSRARAGALIGRRAEIAARALSSSDLT
jgi:drug/metabolite transporter (DMT)-like permease